MLFLTGELHVNSLELRSTNVIHLPKALTPPSDPLEERVDMSLTIRILLEIGSRPAMPLSLNSPNVCEALGTKRVFSSVGNDQGSTRDACGVTSTGADKRLAVLLYIRRIPFQEQFGTGLHPKARSRL